MRSISAHTSLSTWIARSAMKKPPAPWVSWPIVPCSTGIRSSCTRAAKPPGRNEESTASQPSNAARRSVVAETAMSRPRTFAIFSASVRISSSRSGSRSTSTTSEPSKSAPLCMNDAIVPAALVEPPPRYTSLIRATALLLDRSGQHPAHEVPLQEEIHDQDRRGDENGRSSDLGRIARPDCAREEAQPEWRGLVGLAARDEDEREQELVPRIREHEHRHRHHRRP